jgi:hypothetical protein
MVDMSTTVLEEGSVTGSLIRVAIKGSGGRKSGLRQISRALKTDPRIPLDSRQYPLHP